MKTQILVLLIFLSQANIIAQGRLLIRNVSVIPLHIDGVLSHRDVVLHDGVIESMDAHDPADTESYDLGVIDGRGMYLAPAYAESHVHLPKVSEDLEKFVLMNLVNGVTTLRSMRGAEWHLDIDRDTPLSPRWYLSSPPVSRRDTISRSEIMQMVRGYKEAGYDFIKVLSVADSATFSDLVDACAEYDFTMSGHCPRNVGIFNVAKSGVYQSVEHLGGMLGLPDQETLDAALTTCVDQDLYHCPTLDWHYAGQMELDDRRQKKGVEYLDTEDVTKWEKRITSYIEKYSEEQRDTFRMEDTERFAHRLYVLQRMYEQGVRLLLSPDATGIYGVPGYDMHVEMGHYETAGIKNIDILRAASLSLAQMMGEETQWGSIRRGSRSDMLLLKANPLEDIANAQHISGIILRGKYYGHDALQTKLTEVSKK